MGFDFQVYTWPSIHHLYQIYACKFHAHTQVELRGSGNPPLYNIYAYRHIDDQKYPASAECKV